MSRTKIDWCDSVWNPVWGCLHGCSFCYARKFAGRFYKTVARANGLSSEDTERLKNFQPVFLPKNFARRFSKGERVIFVNSMSDPAFWKEDWIEKVIERIKQEPERIFLFLTKAPAGYGKFPERLPPNLWLGVSATNGRELSERVEQLRRVSNTANLFVSLEPLLEEIADPEPLRTFRWVIVGPQTGNLQRKLRQRYERNFSSWLERIEGYCRESGTALFEKEACGRYKGNLVREFPFRR